MFNVLLDGYFTHVGALLAALTAAVFVFLWKRFRRLLPVSRRKHTELQAKLEKTRAALDEATDDNTKLMRRLLRLEESRELGEIKKVKGSGYES